MKRIWRRAVAILALPLLLMMASCARVQANLDIKGEDKIPVHMSVGVTMAVAQGAHAKKEDACRNVVPGENGVPKDAKLEPFEEDGYVGCNVDYTTTMAELNSKSDKPILQHDKQAGKWTFHINADMAKQAAAAQGETADARQVSDFKMAVTFPGSVTSHNGSSTVSGNTVTWTSSEEFFSDEGLKAEAKEGGLGGALGGGGGNNLLVPGIIGGVVLLGVIAAIAVALTRRGRKRTA